MRLEKVRLRRLRPRRLARRLAWIAMERTRAAASSLGLARYQPTPWTKERWHEGYAGGRLDYFAGLDELPRYSILLGYVIFFGGRPDILDVGCGQGLFRTRLQGIDFGRYVGIDPTPAAIEQARRLQDERTEFLVGDPIGTEMGSFDLVVLNEVLSVVPDPAALLERCAGLVRPGGHLLISNWRHPGDRELWRTIEARVEREDLVDVRNPANPIARRGWRVASYRPR